MSDLPPPQWWTEVVLLWPLPSAYQRITSPFGLRTHPVTGKSSMHTGIDIACPQGTPVWAPCDGVVANVWVDERTGGGLSMTLVTADGRLRFGFAHLSETRAAKGDCVERGQVIALSGGEPGTEGAGRSTGPHLHLTIRSLMSGALLDPETLVWVMESEKPEDLP